MIESFIKEHINSKFGSHQSLVVYDDTGFFHDLITEMSNDDIKVFDTSQNIVVERELALEYWMNDLVDNQEKRMIVYVPFKKETDQDLIAKDPFFFFGEGGNYFPSEAMDDYKQLCLAAMPSRSVQIEKIFANESFPSFSLINTLEKGNKYPLLKNAANSESDSEIYVALLTPSDDLKNLIDSDQAILKEIKKWSKDVLKYPLSKKTLSGIQEELWLALLYSEFVFDLPGKTTIPSKLDQVKTIDESSKALVYKVADSIRKNIDHNDKYIEQANLISSSLALKQNFAQEDNLGKINTFSFEDKTYFNQFIQSIVDKNFSRAHQLIIDSKNSIWTRYDEETKHRWNLGKVSYQIFEYINKDKNQITSSTKLESIIENYANKGYVLDRLDREFEKIVSNLYGLNKGEKELISLTRKVYREHTEKVQAVFQSKFQEEFSASNILRNIELFDKKVKPLIKLGKKTAYILVDALRFELAKTFTERLERADFVVEINPSLAFIPSITKYGMAALLPSASKKMSLKVKSGKLEPYFDDIILNTRASRVKYTEELYGDKVIWSWMDDVLNNEIDQSKDIYFITSAEIDGAGENLPEDALLLIEASLKKLLKLCMQLTDAGVEEIVVVADHGFVLNDSFMSGNKADRPTGEWSLSKTRCLAGKGDVSDASIKLSPDDLMIKAEAEAFHFLKQYATYKSGVKYFHEGISLQELVTPFISLRRSKKESIRNLEVFLSYKGKDRGQIRTRRPKITIDSSVEGMLFSEPTDLLIEVFSKDKEVGHLVSSDKVDPTTGYLEITPGQSDNIIIAMNDEFEGEFTVYAKIPSTGLVLSQITLKTDYL